MTITFRELKEIYEKSRYHIEKVNERLAFQNPPENAKWIDKSVLARWFYESSKEWLKEYKKSFDNCEIQKGVAIDWKRKLEGDLDSFKKRLESKFNIKLK